MGPPTPPPKKNRPKHKYPFFSNEVFKNISDNNTDVMATL